MKIRAAIVDDEPLARERLRTLLDEDVEIVCECADGVSAVEAIREKKPDAVFLDIRMPGMDGFEVLDALGSDPLPRVVFLTAYDEHAVRAFEAKALDYLLKPVSRARLHESVSRIRERMAASVDPAELRQWIAGRTMDRRLAVRDGQAVTFVKLGDVEWIESAGNYAVVHTTGGTTLILRETMQALEDELPLAAFRRVSRRAIVNLARVVEIRPGPPGPNSAVLVSGAEVALTRPVREVERWVRER
jgi:two-component system, LytTR family, response regulator